MESPCMESDNFTIGGILCLPILESSNGSWSNRTDLGPQSQHDYKTWCNVSSLNSTAAEISYIEWYLQVIILLIIVIIGIIGNTLMIVCIILFKNMHKTLNLLLLNMAIKDLLIALVVTPLHINSYLQCEWTVNERVCKLAPLLLVVCFFVAVTTQALIAYNRFMYGTRSYQSWIVSSYFTVFLQIFLTWLIAALALLLCDALNAIDFIYQPVYFSCNITAVKQTPVVISAALWVSMCYLVISVCYFQTYAKMDTRILPSSGNPIPTFFALFIQSAKNMVLILILFTLTWLLYPIIYAADQNFQRIPRTIHRISYQALELQPLICPIVHFTRDDEFWDCLCNLLHCHTHNRGSCQVYYVTTSEELNLPTTSSIPAIYLEPYTGRTARSTSFSSVAELPQLRHDTSSIRNCSDNTQSASTSTTDEHDESQNGPT